MIQQRYEVFLPHCESLEGFDSAIKDAPHVAEYVATLTVMLIEGWELYGITTDQGSVLVRVFLSYHTCFGTSFWEKTLKIAPFCQH